MFALTADLAQRPILAASNGAINHGMFTSLTLTFTQGCLYADMVVLTDMPADVLTMIGKQLLPNLVDLIRFSGTNKAIYQFYDSGFWRDVCTAAGYSIAASATGGAGGNYRNLAISLVRDALKNCHPARLRYNDDKRIIRYFLFYDLLDWDYLDLPQLRFNGIGTRTFCGDIRFHHNEFSLFIAKKYASGEYYAKHFVNVLDRPLFKNRLVSTASTQRLLYNDLKSTPTEIEILNVNGVVVADVLNAIKENVSYWDAKFNAWDSDHIGMPEDERADDRNGVFLGFTVENIHVKPIWGAREP